MKIYASMAHASAYLRPSLQTLWKGRFVQVMGVIACASLLYYLATRIRNLFSKKESLLSAKNFLEASRIAEKPRTAHIAEKLPPSQLTLASALPDEVLQIIFKHTRSLASFSALSETCHKFNGMTQGTPEFVKETIEYIIEDQINPYIEDALKKKKDALKKKNYGEIVTVVVRTISYFPRSVVFPEPNGPCIPMIRAVLEKLGDNIAKNAITRTWIHVLRPSLHDFREKRLYPPNSTLSDTVTALDKKFLHNIPDTELTYFTRAEIEELSRRYDANELTKRDDTDGLPLTWHKGFLKIHIPLIITYSSCEFFQHLLQILADKIEWEKWIPHLCAIEDPLQFYEKLRILGEHYKHHHHQWSFDKQASDLALLLFPTMKALGWEKEAITTNPSPLELETILLWIPDSKIRFINGFATDLKRLPQIPDQALYAYTYEDLFAFMQYLAAQRPELHGPSLFDPVESLQKNLRAGGATLSFSWIVWEFHIMSQPPQDIYRTVCILGDYYKLNHPKWSPQKKTATLEMLLFPAMHLLQWEPFIEEDLPIKRKKGGPVPENTQISFRCAVFSCIPQDYFVREKFQKDAGKSKRSDLGQDDPYTYDDLFAFIGALRKEFEATDTHSRGSQYYEKNQKILPKKS